MSKVAGTGHEMYCPNYQVITKGVDYPAAQETAKLWTKEEWLSRLNENFNFAILRTPSVSGSDPEREHIANMIGFLDPDNGLEMVEKVTISPPNSDQNTWPPTD
jgi:hypothetical protein